MTGPARKLLSYQDLLAADRTFGPVPELIHGEIAWKAAPRARHSVSHARLAGHLWQLGPPGPTGDGWWIMSEPDVQVAPHLVVRPDLAGWRTSTLPECPDGRVFVRPDWVGEVLSPSHETYDLVDKRQVYADHGVPHLWLVHPEERWLEAFELQAGRWLLLGAWTDGARVRARPFEDVEIDISALFAPRTARPSGEEG